MEQNKIHQGLSYEQYRDAPGVRSSDLKLFKRSPAHWKAAQENPKQHSEALEFGKLFHSVIENGEKFMSQLKVMPEFIGLTKEGKESKNSKEAKEKKEAWLNDQPENVIIISAEEERKITGMVKSLAANKTLTRMIKDSVREASIWATDNETGLTVKCRPDLITAKGFVLDFKTTMDCSEKIFEGDIYKQSRYSPFYILQAAHYTHVMRMAGIGNPDLFCFVAVEKDPPYAMNTFELKIDSLGAGDQWRSMLTKKYAECEKNQEWPFNDGRVIPLAAPEWFAIPEDENN